MLWTTNQLAKIDKLQVGYMKKNEDHISKISKEEICYMLNAETKKLKFRS